MARNVKLLLVETVENLGIVGDVVNVRNGFARNFLLPRALATAPSEEKVKELAAKRAEAQRQLAEQRKQREELSEKLQGVEVHLTRSCNDQGILYGAITQQDVAAALNEQGFAVKPRDIRIAQTIKRIDAYDVHVKLDSDLDATIKLWVVADRKLDLDRGHPTEAPPAEEAAPAEGEAGDKPRKGKKVDAEPPAKADKKKAEKPAKEPAAEDEPAKKGKKEKKAK